MANNFKYVLPSTNMHRYASGAEKPDSPYYANEYYNWKRRYKDLHNTKYKQQNTFTLLTQADIYHTYNFAYEGYRCTTYVSITASQALAYEGMLGVTYGLHWSQYTKNSSGVTTLTYEGNHFPVAWRFIGRVDDYDEQDMRWLNDRGEFYYHNNGVFHNNFGPVYKNDVLTWTPDMFIKSQIVTFKFHGVKKDIDYPDANLTFHIRKNGCIYPAIQYKNYQNAKKLYCFRENANGTSSVMSFTNSSIPYLYSRLVHKMANDGYGTTKVTCVTDMNDNKGPLLHVNPTYLSTLDALNYIDLTILHQSTISSKENMMNMSFQEGVVRYPETTMTDVEYGNGIAVEIRGSYTDVTTIFYKNVPHRKFLDSTKELKKVSTLSYKNLMYATTTSGDIYEVHKKKQVWSDKVLCPRAVKDNYVIRTLDYLYPEKWGADYIMFTTDFNKVNIYCTQERAGLPDNPIKLCMRLYGTSKQTEYTYMDPMPHIALNVHRDSYVYGLLDDNWANPITISDNNGNIDPYWRSAIYNREYENLGRISTIFMRNAEYMSSDYVRTFDVTDCYYADDDNVKTQVTTFVVIYTHDTSDTVEVDITSMKEAHKILDTTFNDSYLEVVENNMKYFFSVCTYDKWWEMRDLNDYLDLTAEPGRGSISGAPTVQTDDPRRYSVIASYDIHSVKAMKNVTAMHLTTGSSINSSPLFLNITDTTNVSSYFYNYYNDASIYITSHLGKIMMYKDYKVQFTDVDDRSEYCVYFLKYSTLKAIVEENTNYNYSLWDEDYTFDKIISEEEIE